MTDIYDYKRFFMMNGMDKNEKAGGKINKPLHKNREIVKSEYRLNSTDFVHLLLV